MRGTYPRGRVSRWPPSEPRTVTGTVTVTVGECVHHYVRGRLGPGCPALGPDSQTESA